MNLSLFRQLRAERQKLRHKKAFLVPLLFLGFQSLWLLWQLTYLKPEETPFGYSVMLYQLPIVDAILLPLMTALIASRVCDMEVKGDTLKLLFTVQKQRDFYDCKYLSCLKYLLFFVLGQGAVILIAGTLSGFGNFRPGALLLYLVQVFAVSAVSLCIQQALSLLSQTQLLPLGVGLAGCFLGLFSMFFPKPVNLLVLWGYYAVFSTTGMDWDRATRISTYYEVPFPVVTFVLFLAAGAVLYLVCRAIVLKKEV